MSIRTLAVAAMLCVAVFGGTWFVVSALVAPPPAPVAPQVVTMGTFKPVEPPRPLPELGLTALDGTPLGPEAFRGRLTLLNVWATWCAPCIKEMPSLDRLQVQLGGPGFAVVALSVDRGGAHQVTPFLEKTGVANLTTVLDPPGKSMQALGLRGLPTTLLLDAQGREVARFEGAAEWDSPAMVEELRGWMAKGS